jgi:uncharacterized protein YukE
MLKTRILDQTGPQENPPREVTVSLNSQGWTLSCGDQSAGPFQYLNQIDEMEAARQLGTTPKEVWKAKIRVYSFSTEPKTIERTDEINLENLTIIPSFNQPLKKIHPAMAITEDRAYVGITLPCTVIQNKNSENNGQKEQELLFLITSLKETILAHKDILRKLDLKLACTPTILPNRWDLKSVQAFLSNENVNPAKVYTAIKEAWKQYIEFDNPAYYDLLTLWIIGTYFFHIFNSYPYIYLGGIKRTGKTKALTLASALAFNAIFSANVSTSSVFRLIQNNRCTLLIDETEKLANAERAQDFRGLLLCGYKKGGVVYRTEKTRKDQYKPEAFEVYSPKMLANIRGLEDVLEDRCITIIMKRAKNPQILNTEINLNDPLWQKIRDNLYMLYLTYWKRIKEIYENASELSVVNELNEHAENISLLSGRELELWKPILILAKFFDNHDGSVPSQTTQTPLSSLMLRLALNKAEEKRTENMTETGDCILVETLLDLVKTDDYYKVKQIRDEMATHFDEEQKWLNTQWVGRSLKRLGFTDKRRVGTGYEYRLTKQAINDIAERLGIQQATTTTEVSETENLIQNLRKNFTKGTQQEFENLTKQINPNLTDHEATTLFNQLVENGRLARDADGWWQWTK